MKQHQIGGRSIRDYLEDIIGDGDVEGLEGGEGSWMQKNWDKAVGGVLGAGVGGMLLWKLLARRRTGVSARNSSPSGSSRRRRRRRH